MHDNKGSAVGQVVERPHPQLAAGSLLVDDLDKNSGNKSPIAGNYCLLVCLTPTS